MSLVHSAAVPLVFFIASANLFQVLSQRKACENPLSLLRKDWCSDVSEESFFQLIPFIQAAAFKVDTLSVLPYNGCPLRTGFSMYNADQLPSRVFLVFQRQGISFIYSDATSGFIFSLT